VLCEDVVSCKALLEAEKRPLVRKRPQAQLLDSVTLFPDLSFYNSIPIMKDEPPEIAAYLWPDLERSITFTFGASPSGKMVSGENGVRVQKLTE